LLYSFSQVQTKEKKFGRKLFFSLYFFSNPHKRKKITFLLIFFLLNFFSLSTFYPPYFPRSKQGLGAFHGGRFPPSTQKLQEERDRERDFERNKELRR